MNISSISSVHSGTDLAPASAKQGSQTGKQTKKSIEASDSFTKSTAADEALRNQKNNTTKSEGNTSVKSEQTDSKTSKGILENANIDTNNFFIKHAVSTANGERRKNRAI